MSFSPYFWRFNVHLPLLYNNGAQIEPEKIDAMLEDLQKQFGGYTKTPHIGHPTVEGFYRSGDKIYYDALYLIEIDVPDCEKEQAIKYFKSFRDKYMKIYDQVEIYIVYYDINRII